MEQWRLDEIVECLGELGRTNIAGAVTRDFIEEYRGKVADALLFVWEKEGFRAYGNGIVWLTRPDQYREVLKHYLKGTPYEQVDTFHVFKRTAFGGLYAVGEVTGQTITINIKFNAIVANENKFRAIIQDKNDPIWSSLTDTDRENFDCEDYLEKPLFDRALAKFGMLRADEVYAFDPLLIQATKKDDLSLEHIVVKNIVDYIEAVRAVAKPSIPFAGIHVDTDNL